MAESATHIVLGVTGSIAAYKAADLIRLFRKKDWRVSVIMTRAAEEFITPLTLGTLSGEKVWRDMFAKEAEERSIAHLSLSLQADVLVIAPASADAIGKIAGGLADDLLSATAMATKAPMVIAPAMNMNMYENQIVQQNCDRLKQIGVRFVGPCQGKLACGVWGTGHLALLEDIVHEVEAALKQARQAER